MLLSLISLLLFLLYDYLLCGLGGLCSDLGIVTVFQEVVCTFIRDSCSLSLSFFFFNLFWSLYDRGLWVCSFDLSDKLDDLRLILLSLHFIMDRDRHELRSLGYSKKPSQVTSLIIGDFQVENVLRMTSCNDPVLQFLIIGTLTAKLTREV